jgi:hypothetical protein
LRQAAEVQLFLVCPNCKESKSRFDHIRIGESAGPWACDYCHWYYRFVRVNETEIEIELTVRRETPVTVTLRSQTDPPITLKLHTWKYAHSQNDSPEEYAAQSKYFYNEHTCPTNWTREIQQIIFEGNRDPHGVFEFVSVEEGHVKEGGDS